MRTSLMKIYNEETMYYGYWIGSNLWKERSEDKTRVLLEFPRTMEETELQKQNYNPKKVSGGHGGSWVTIDGS